MKRLHQIAAVRRLVALTVLSALLFSSTAVYADTAVDGANPSGETVVSETGNTSNDLNSSTNLDNTVSGTDITDNDSNTTTEKTDEVAEGNDTVDFDLSNSDDSDDDVDMASLLGESKLLLSWGPMPKKTCDHESTYFNYVNASTDDRSEHKVIEICCDCGEELSSTTEECSFDAASRYEKSQNDDKHFQVKTCKCGNECWGEEVDCSYKPVYKNDGTICYVKEGSDSHKAKTKCEYCGRESFDEPVKCELKHTEDYKFTGNAWEYTFKHKERLHCDDCGRDDYAEEEDCACEYGFAGSRTDKGDHYEHTHVGTGHCSKCNYYIMLQSQSCTEKNASYTFDKNDFENPNLWKDGKVVTYYHTEKNECATCHQKMLKKVACEFDDWKFDTTYDGKSSSTSQHRMIRHCKVCGQAETKMVDCEPDFNEWHYLKRADGSFFGNQHIIARECQVCNHQETQREDCNWHKVFFFKNLEFCSDCFNIHDTRSQDAEKFISKIDIVAADGSKLVKAPSLNDEKGFTHEVYDSDVKVVVTIQSDNFNNDKTDADWAEKMDVKLHLNTPDERTETMTYVKGSKTADGTAKFAYTVKALDDRSLSIAGVSASYCFTEDYKSNLTKLKALGTNDEYHLYDEYIDANHTNTKSFSGSKEIAAIVRNSDPSNHITDSTITIANQNNSWKPGDSVDKKWYSKEVNGNQDLVVTVTGTTGKPLAKETVSLREKGATSGITAEPSTSVKYSNAKVTWNNKFAHNVYVSYANEYKFVVKAGAGDIKDGKHTYNVSNSNIKDDIDLYIDNTKPEYQQVKYSSAAERLNGKYYKENVTVTVVAVDANLNLDESKSYIYFKENENKHIAFNSSNATATVEASTDGKYTVAGVIYDKAGNFVNIDNEKEFVVDKTAPTIKVNFDNHEVKHQKYYKDDRTATFELYDLNIDSKEAVMSDVIFTSKEGKATVNGMQGSDGKYIGTIVFNQDGIYKIDDLKFTDKAGNLCKVIDGTDKDYNAEFVIDKTVPTIAISFDNNSAANEIYYKAARTAELTFTERNFTADQVTVKKSGGDQNPVPALSGYSSSNDNNITKISFDKDGRYGFEVFVEDLAGNISDTKVIDTFVIDMTNPVLEISGVEDMSANNGAVVPLIKSQDVNINDLSTEITLTGSNNGVIKPNISKTVSTEIFTYTIADLAHEKKNDDLYTLSVKLTDLAGNEVDKKIQYSVNRFGSIFVLSDATKAMVDGYYVTKPQDVVITEINVDALSKKEVSVAFDGSVKELREGVAFTTSDTTNSNGWHSISYKVDKSNFNKDGIYSVNVYSEDKASNRQSSQSKEAEVEFLLDKTAPSVIVSGIEDGGIYEEESHDFSVNAADTIGVNSMTVYLNGEKLGSYTASELAENGGTVVLTIPTKDDYQKVSIQCTDVAGNTTNLEYNNLLVSVKAEELLLEDNLTPTSNLGAGEEGTDGIISNSSKAIVVVIVFFAFAACGGAGVYAFRKKKSN